VDLNSTVKM